MAENYYVTPKMIKEYNLTLKKEDQSPPSFYEMLLQMQDAGLLSEDPLPMPFINGKMEVPEFLEAYDSIPFQVNSQLIAIADEREEKGLVVFPDHTDLLCMQQLHNNIYFDQTINNAYAITYVYKGFCSYTFDDRTLTVHPGDIFIATPGFSHRIFTVSGTFALVIMFRSTAFQILFQDFLTADTAFSDFFRKTITEKESGNYCVINGAPEDGDLTFYLQSLVCETFSEHPYSNSNAACMLKLFLSTAYDKYSDHMRIYKRFPGTERADAKTVLQYIQNNYQDISLNQVASHFHYNKTYLSRFIHSHFGKTYCEIVNELKIEHAKEYLRKTNKSITEISQLAGFESYDHFSRTFRKYTGCSPGNFRKRK
ncbi:MAG: helix-turn-helix transcriptional regulator [Parasporobacterium sp.]|nr:helix-turn-helix transcriptional regulator [Parasporobacterium sp.]